MWSQFHIQGCTWRDVCRERRLGQRLGSPNCSLPFVSSRADCGPFWRWRRDPSQEGHWAARRGGGGTQVAPGPDRRAHRRVPAREGKSGSVLDVRAPSSKVLEIFLSFSSLYIFREMYLIFSVDLIKAFTLNRNILNFIRQILWMACGFGIILVDFSILLYTEFVKHHFFTN